MNACAVLVVGGGPVGMATALFLTDHGVSVQVVDRGDPFGGPPRASAGVRTLELYRSIGLGGELDRTTWAGPAPLHSVVKESASGAVISRAEPPARYAERLARCSPIDVRTTATQADLGEFTFDQVRRRGGRVRLGVELVGLDQSADTVSAHLLDTTTGQDERVECRYLVAADGAHSRVRDLLGITVPDRQVADRLNTAFFRADLRPLLPEAATHACFIRNEDVHATLFAKSADGRHWSSHVMDYPGKPDALTRLPPQRTVELLRAAIGDDSVPIELIECRAWEAAIGLAASLRRGRVFLAGDAAHMQTSAGGLGMNTGIQDGHNLAWKLAAVLSGHAHPDLLDSYDSERRAAARASLAVSHGLHRGYRAGRDSSDLYARLAADYLRGMFGYRYESPAVLPDHDGEGDPDDVLDDRAHPGRRLPHRPLADGRSTLDLVDRRWTLLIGPDGAGWQAAGDQVPVRPVTPDPDPPAFVSFAGTRPGGALLVRPDGFVAWRSRDLPDDPAAAVASALRTLLGPA